MLINVGKYEYLNQWLAVSAWVKSSNHSELQLSHLENGGHASCQAYIPQIFHTKARESSSAQFPYCMFISLLGLP